MRVSVVVISRNEAPRLRLALASYERAVASAAAGGIPAEIVVVDDGSTDATREVIAASTAVLPLVAIHNPTGTGIAEARNRGAAAATGDVLLFMDGDVLLAPDGLVAHAEAHGGRKQPAIVRGASSHLRCTRAFLDPQDGTPFPGQEEAVARMGAELAGSIVTAADVRDRFDTIDARARPGIYVGSVNADLYAAEIEALVADGGRDVCWMSVPGHNVSIPRAAFAASGGYDGRQIPVEPRELGLRLCEAGLDVAYAGRARSYHLAHKGRGRDPLSGRQDWITAFFGRHSAPAAKLMLVFWHSIARSKAIPADARIDSILHLARILRAGAAPRYESVFRDLVAAAAAESPPALLAR